MIRFEDYKDRFKYIRLERHDGILEVTLRGDGGQAMWDAAEGGIHHRLLNDLGYGLALEGLGVLGLTNSQRD